MGPIATPGSTVNPNDYEFNQVIASPDGKLFVSAVVRATLGRPVILYSSDGGATYRAATTPPKGLAGMADILAANGNSLFALTNAADSSGLYRSDDGGRSWQSVPWPYAVGTIISIFVANSQLFAVAGPLANDEIRIYATPTDRIDWTERGTFGGSFRGDFAVDGPAIALVGNNGTNGFVVQSANGGSSFGKPVPVPQIPDVYTAAFYGGSLYVGGNTAISTSSGPQTRGVLETMVPGSRSFSQVAAPHYCSVAEVLAASTEGLTLICNLWSSAGDSEGTGAFILANRATTWAAAAKLGSSTSYEVDSLFVWNGLPYGVYESGFGRLQAAA